MTPRFDVVLGETSYIDYHFCREFDGKIGCFGHNPEHGLSFEEAKGRIVEWYSSRAKEWQEKTYEDWLNYE